MAEQIPQYVRVPTSEDPNKVYKTGAGGFPIRDPEHLLLETGAESTEEAFKQVQDIGADEATAMGIRLPGTPAIYGTQTETLTPEMLASIPAGEVTPTEIEEAEGLPNAEDVLGGKPDTSTLKDQLGSASTTIASLQQSLIDIQKQLEDRATKAKEDAEAEQKGILDKIKGAIGWREKKEKELKEEEDLEAKQEAYKDILGKIQTRQAFLFGELRNIEGERVSAARMGREQAETKRQAQIDLALLQAQASILQNDYNFAKQSIDTTMGYIDSDKKDEMNYYDTLLSLANQNVVSFTKDEKDAFNAQLGIIEKAAEDKKAELQHKSDLMLDAYKTYGVILPDLTGLTPEEADKVFGDTISPLVTEERELELAKARADIARTQQLLTGDDEETLFESLDDDIKKLSGKNLTKDQTIEQLQLLYPELTPAVITNRVNESLALPPELTGDAVELAGELFGYSTVTPKAVTSKAKKETGFVGTIGEEGEFVPTVKEKWWE